MAILSPVPACEGGGHPESQVPKGDAPWGTRRPAGAPIVCWGKPSCAGALSCVLELVAVEVQADVVQPFGDQVFVAGVEDVGIVEQQ